MSDAIKESVRTCLDRAYEKSPFSAQEEIAHALADLCIIWGCVPEKMPFEAVHFCRWCGATQEEAEDRKANRLRSDDE